MKTKTVHTIAIALLFVMSGINIYADSKHRLGVIDSQINARQNLMGANTALLELKVSIDQLPIFFEAINQNQKAVIHLQNRQGELWEAMTFQIEERNKKFLKKLRGGDPFLGQFGMTIITKPCQKTEGAWHPSGSDDPGCWRHDDPYLKQWIEIKKECDFSINGSPLAPECLPYERYSK